MTDNQRETRRKLWVLEHPKQGGNVSMTCRAFGVGRAGFYRWLDAYPCMREDWLSHALRSCLRQPARSSRNKERGEMMKDESL